MASLILSMRTSLFAEHDAVKRLEHLNQSLFELSMFGFELPMC
jgi:hypothetical protein